MTKKKVISLDEWFGNIQAIHSKQCFILIKIKADGNFKLLAVASEATDLGPMLDLKYKGMEYVGWNLNINCYVLTVVNFFQDTMDTIIDAEIVIILTGENQDD